MLDRGLSRQCEPELPLQHNMAQVRVYVLSVVLAVLVVVSESATGKGPSSVVEALRAPLTNMPLATLFGNMRERNIVTYYVECVIDEGACNNIGRALKEVVLDQRATLQLCGGCDRCQRERVQYVLDTLNQDYPDLACRIQTALKWNGIFGSNNPCSRVPA